MFITPKFTPGQQARKLAGNEINFLASNLTSANRLKADSTARRGTPRWVDAARKLHSTNRPATRRPATKPTIRPVVKPVAKRIPRQPRKPAFSATLTRNHPFALRGSDEWAFESYTPAVETFICDIDEGAWGTELDFEGWRGFGITTRP